MLFSLVRSFLFPWLCTSMEGRSWWERADGGGEDRERETETERSVWRGQGQRPEESFVVFSAPSSGPDVASSPSPFHTPFLTYYTVRLGKEGRRRKKPSDRSFQRPWKKKLLFFSFSLSTEGNLYPSPFSPVLPRTPLSSTFINIRPWADSKRKKHNILIYPLSLSLFEIGVGQRADFKIYKKNHYYRI